MKLLGSTNAAPVARLTGYFAPVNGFVTAVWPERTGMKPETFAVVGTVVEEGAF